MSARVWRALAALMLLAIGMLPWGEAVADARSENLPGLMSLMPPQQNAGPTMSLLPRTAQARCRRAAGVSLARMRLDTAPAAFARGRRPTSTTAPAAARRRRRRAHRAIAPGDRSGACRARVSIARLDAAVAARLAG